jgi:hypothetical protein
MTPLPQPERHNHHMRSQPLRILLVWTLFILAGIGSGLCAEEPIASGPLGYINAKNGDSMFDTTFHALADAGGAELAVKLEPKIGADLTLPGVSPTRKFSAVWTGIATPKSSGIFRLRLRATDAASLSVDGVEVITRHASEQDFESPSTAEVKLVAGRSYEFVARLTQATSASRIAATWELAEAQEAAVSPTPRQSNEPVLATRGEPAILENADYRVQSTQDGSLVVTQRKQKISFTFQPEFTVLFLPPGQALKFESAATRYTDAGPVGNTNYFVPSWNKNPDFFAAAPRIHLRASSAMAKGGAVIWTFPSQPGFTLEAKLQLDSNGGEPEILFTLTPEQAGHYSVGYVGAPKEAMNDSKWIWQPLVWQDKRVPNLPYLTLEYQCPIPFTLVGNSKGSVGVGANPSEMPFRMATGGDSRFGVLVRNADGEAQPQIFAPVFGGHGSMRQKGEPFSFGLRLFVGGESWFDGYRTLSQGLYGFSDVRENALCSLNTTIENLTDFFLNDTYCYWYPEFKSWGYQNDAGPDGIRQQSAAYALGLALSLDREDVLRRRAIPTVEYMLTRQELGGLKSDGNLLGGPVKRSADFVAAHRLLLERNPALRDAALKTNPAISKGVYRAPRSSKGTITHSRNSLLGALGLYRLTGDPARLEDAKNAADIYIQERIAKPATSFADAGSSFWTELAPCYDALYELYESTGDKRYLDAATRAMESFSAFVCLAPNPPSAEFTANAGGQHNGVPIPEERVPAWRVAPNGLAAECAGTAHSHRAIFMASYAGYMARLARDANQPFFRDIARNSTIGRYSNYPSYAYRRGYTTLFEKPDYPLRPFEQIKKVTSAHYNHPLPMAAFLLDFLVSDFYDRSDGKITFPSEYTNTGAYFRSKVYGAGSGSFYGDQGVYLWLPPKLLEMNSVSLNYLAARGSDRLYLAFANTSDREVQADFQIAPSRVDLAGPHQSRVWINNQPTASMVIENGKGRISVPPKGLLALAIEGAKCKTQVQEAMLDTAVTAFAEASTQDFPTPIGIVKASALNYGRGLATVHVLVMTKPGEFERVDLTWTENGTSHRIEKEKYPFEFTVPIADDSKTFDFSLETTTSNGSKSTGPLQLNLR